MNDLVLHIYLMRYNSLDQLYEVYEYSEYQHQLHVDEVVHCYHYIDNIIAVGPLYFNPLK